MWNGVLSYKLQKEHSEDGFIAFASKSKRFIIARVILLLVFLPTVYGTWDLREKHNVFPTLTWSVPNSVPGYSTISKRYLIRLTEKVLIATYENLEIKKRYS